MTTLVSLNANSSYTQELIKKAQNGDNNAVSELCSGLYNATAGKLGTDENYVNYLMQNADSKTLASIIDNYSDVTGSEIYKDIENDFSGKAEQEILAKLNEAYKEANNEEYVGWDDGKLSIQDTVKSAGKGLLNKLPSVAMTVGGVLLGKTAIGTCISGIAGSALTTVFGASAAAVATFAAPVLAALGVATAGYMIYKGVTQTAQAIKDGSNATTDDEMKNAIQEGTEGVIDTGLGVYAEVESAKALKDSIGNVKEFKANQEQLRIKHEQQIQAEAQARIKQEQDEFIEAMQHPKGKSAQESAEFFDDIYSEAERKTAYDQQIKRAEKVQEKYIEAMQHPTGKSALESAKNFDINTFETARERSFALTENPDLVYEFYNGNTTPDEFAEKMVKYLKENNQGSVLENWGQDGKQLIKHTYAKIFGDNPDRLATIEERIIDAFGYDTFTEFSLAEQNTPLGNFSKLTDNLIKFSQENLGTNNGANALRYITSKTISHADGEKTFYWIGCQAKNLVAGIPTNDTEGIICLLQNGKIQSVMPSLYKYFLSAK